MRFYKYIFILTIALAFSTSKLSAQNILTATIEWKSNSTFDAASGTNIDEKTRVVSTPTQITWYDSKNAVKQTINIESADGTWTNVSNNGSIVLKITSDGSSGIAQFMKSDGTTRIRIHLVNANETFIYDLTVTDINTL